MPSRALPFQIHLLTLRVCADLRWRVSVSCPRCRYGVLINADKLAGAPLGATPLGELLMQRTFRCRAVRAGKSCDGEPAAALDVSYMHVGRMRVLAAWTLTETGVTWSEPAPD